MIPLSVSPQCPKNKSSPISRSKLWQQKKEDTCAGSKAEFPKDGTQSQFSIIFAVFSKIMIFFE